MKIKPHYHSENSGQFNDFDEIEITEKNHSDQDLEEISLLENKNGSRDENQNDLELTIEEELEILAAKLGGDNRKISGDKNFYDEENGDEFQSKTGNSEISLKIFADQKLKDFADIKVVSVHPRIKNEVQIRIDETKFLISSLQKLIKLM